MGYRKRSNKKQTQGIVIGDDKKAAHTTTPPPPQNKKPTIKKVVLIIIGVGLAAIFVIGGGLAYREINKVTVVTVPSQSNEVLTPPAQDEALVIEPATEIADIEKQISVYPKENLNPKQKIMLANLYSALGAAYVNADLGNDAIAAYQDADKYAAIEQQRAILAGKAYAYASLGQNEDAIKEFELLIVHIKEFPNPSTARDIAGIQRQIESLKKGEAL